MAFIKYLIFGAVAAGLIATYLLRGFPDNRLHIYFLDVGQGDSILIQSPDKRYILVDAGPSSSAQKLISNITGNFRRRIDLVIVTHPHNDHYAGLIDIVGKYEIGTIILPVIAGNEPLYNSFLNEIQKRKIKTVFAPSKTDINFGAGVYLDIIDIPAPITKNANEASALIRILYGRLSIFLTGDAPTEEEFAALATNQDLRADILKVGHHGSKYSTTEEFLSAVQPAIAVIQSGIKNRFGHPHPETLSRLQKFNAQIFRNDEKSTIEFVF
ncbi:MBL fold metallo-hydrolase [Candidatus Peregrinibacteria bacterium]|nr:MBL fold metallo-hydrolase [Candidatus Peregrinibacteria bacterium]